MEASQKGLNMSLSVVVLAAGQGKRMRSKHPKVLAPLAGEPLLAHVLATARALDPERIVVVYGHGGEALRQAFPDADLRWAEQAEQRGTADAVCAALPLLPEEGKVLVLCGDVPLLQREMLAPLVEASEEALAVLTARVDNPRGYGRILRDDAGEMNGIVEERDAMPAQRAIDEVNTGVVAAPLGKLRAWLQRIDRDDAEGERYCSDAVALAA